MADFTIDFTSKDYASLVSQASLFAASILPEWTSRDDNDINWATIKTVAYLVSIGMFYIDLGVNEQDPWEVQIYRNALRLAKRYGMPVKKVAGATATILATVTSHTTTLTVHRGIDFTYGTYTYSLWDDVVFAASVTASSFPVVYGEFERYQLGVSDGSDFQQFTVDRDLVADKKVRILINDAGNTWVTDPTGFVEWEQRDTLLMSYETDTHYRLVLGEDEKYLVMFGDDCSGKAPINGAVIVAEVLKMPSTYLTQDYGNLAAGNIDTTSATATIVSLYQIEAATGGAAKETVTSIGRSLPQWISTANRALAPKDYVYLAKRVSGVDDATVSMTGLVANLYIKPSSGSVATAALLQAVEDYISPRMIEDHTLNVVALNVVGINVTMNLVVQDSYKRVTVQSFVDDAMSVLLASKTEFLPLMDVYDAIKAVSGVKSVSVTELYKVGDSASLGDVTLLVNQITAKGTVSISATGGIV